jgi:lipoate-protein ligase A
LKIHFLNLKDCSIYEQLALEEALIRTNIENWCIVNDGSEKSIVMGISGKKEELIDLKKAKEKNIPVIKRFSGGGTVIVDENTLFATFILNKSFFSFDPYPERILKWSEEFYQKALSIPSFHLKENDYVLGNLKCGGNAQYLKKDRILHHTSFLWDFEEENMQILLHPKKTPSYREQRAHNDFLCRIKPHIPCKDLFKLKIKESLERDYTVSEVSKQQILGALSLDHRKTLEKIPL